MKKIQNSNTNTEVTDGVYNDGAFIRLVFNGNMIQVNKSQIKTIDTVRNDIVRLDIGEGAMKNIYIRLNEVQYPLGIKTVTALRNYIKGLMIQNGFATEAKQDNAISEMQQVKQLLTAIKTLLSDRAINTIDFTVKQPLREDDSIINVIYSGYAIPNAESKHPLWAIQKVSRVGNEIIYEWANGNQLHNNVWDARYSLKYYPIGYIK